MGSDAAAIAHVPKSSPSVKVHNSICSELTKILDTIAAVLPAIESARPGYTAGIQELCSLNNSLEKARLLIQHCVESSKLYLAITAESVVLRCERIRGSLTRSLCHVQNMVPEILAVRISSVLDCLEDAKFLINPTEEEAGRVMLELLRLTDSSKEIELNAFQTAVSSLRITSPKALLIETRSIKKLLDKIHGSDLKKERILNYFLYLIRQYGKRVKEENCQLRESQSPQDGCLESSLISAPNIKTFVDNSEPLAPDEIRSDLPLSDQFPEEFCCPISSRLMYDPVVIASGQTFERMSIERWFSEGHVTCPKTQKKLKNLYMIPNSSMKDLISNWCRKHDVNLENPSLMFQSWEPSRCSSISSLKNVSAALLDRSHGDYMLQSDNSCLSFVSSDASYCSDSSHVKGMDCTKDDQAKSLSWSDDYLRGRSFSEFDHEMYMRFFSKLADLPLDQRDKALDELRIILGRDEEMCYAMLSNGFAEALITFLKSTCDLSDAHAQETGAQVFLAFLSNNRVEIPFLNEDAFQLLTSFLESEIALEALMVLQKLSRHPNPKSIIAMSSLAPSVVKILDYKDHDFLKVAVEILADLSSHSELKPHIISSGCIQKLAPLLTDTRLAEICLNILHNLSDLKEAVVLISETNGCIGYIVELLETGSRQGQEHGVAVLRALCSQSLEYCLLVMKEGVIPSLVDISVNGSNKGKETSMELLHLLKDLRLSGSFETSEAEALSTPSEIAVEDATNRCAMKQPVLWPVSKPAGFLARKMKSLLKSRTVALS